MVSKLIFSVLLNIYCLYVIFKNIICYNEKQYYFYFNFIQLFNIIYIFTEKEMMPVCRNSSLSKPILGNKNKLI